MKCVNKLLNICTYEIRTHASESHSNEKQHPLLVATVSTTGNKPSAFFLWDNHLQSAWIHHLVTSERMRFWFCLALRAMHLRVMVMQECSPLLTRQDITEIVLAIMAAAFPKAKALPTNQPALQLKSNPEASEFL